MGKIRVAVMGGTEESDQKRRAKARRQTKQSKKQKGEPKALAKPRARLAKEAMASLADQATLVEFHRVALAARYRIRST